MNRAALQKRSPSTVTCPPSQSRDACVDAADREADRAAERVLALPENVRYAAGQGFRPTELPTNQVEAFPASVSRTLGQTGTPLEPALQADMELRFGYDFSRVRVHADRAAAESALEVDARAYTVGHHVVFGAHQLSPHSHGGRSLIAHELAHVVQQAPRGPLGPTARVLQRKKTIPAARDSGTQGEPVPRSDYAANVPADLETAAADVPPAIVETDDPVAARFDKPQPRSGPPPVSSALRIAPPVGDSDSPANADALPTQTNPVPLAADKNAEGDRHMPSLSSLFTEPEIAAEETDNEMQVDAPPAAQVDLNGLLGSMVAGARQARKIIDGHSHSARSDVDQRAKLTQRKVEKQTGIADAAVRATANARRDQLDKTIAAHDQSIVWLEKRCKDDAQTYAKNATAAQKEGFDSSRKNLAEVFDVWVRRFAILETKQIDRLKAKIKAYKEGALSIAHNYDRRLIQAIGGQSERRKEVQHDAVYALAFSYSEEVSKVELETIPEISSACRSVKEPLETERDKALLEFDKGFPQVESGIKDQLREAEEEIARRAAESRNALRLSAATMRDRIGVLEEISIRRNAALRARLDAQIEEAREGAGQQFRRAVVSAMQPIAAVMEEAVGILVNRTEELDADAAPTFVDEVIAFAQDGAESTGEIFVDAREANGRSLAGILPFAKRGFAAGKDDLETTFHAEGVENETGLIKFGGEVETHLKAALTMLDETYLAAVQDAGTRLDEIVNGTREAMRPAMEETREKVKKAVSDVIGKAFDAKDRLPLAMHNAARLAAWRYDHPYRAFAVDALEVVLGFAAAIAIVIGLVVLLPLIVGEAAAAVIVTLIVLIGAFAIGYFGAKAYDERRAAKQSKVSAFFGAIADVTGISDVKRAFTDAKMAPFDRGFAWGGFWLNLFGAAAGAPRFLRALKFRLPKTFTNPFKFKRPVAAMSAEAHLPRTTSTPELAPQAGHHGFKLPHEDVPPGAVNAPAVAKPDRIGFELPNQRPSSPEITPGPKRGMGFKKSEEVAVPETTPQGPKRGMGFKKSEEVAVPESAPQGPKRGMGFKKSEEVAVPETTPPAPKRGMGFKKSEELAPPSTVPESPVTSPTQGTVDVRGVHHGDPQLPAQTPPPSGARMSANDAGSAGAPTVGKVSPIQPDAPAVRAPRQSKHSQLAEQRVSDTEAAQRNAATNRTAAEKQVADLDEELKYLDELKQLFARSERGEVNAAIKKAKGDLKKAKSELKETRRVEDLAKTEAMEVAHARTEIQKIESKLDRIQKKQTALEQKLDPADPAKFRGQPPRTGKDATKYRLLEEAKAKLRAKREGRTKDLTRSIAEHVEGMVPGERGKPIGLANAENFPALKPDGGKPIDVMTGKPIEGDSWATDHLMSRNEIARDPRFSLLDADGRWQMINDIPENFLPLSKSANSSKGKKSIKSWLAKLSGKKSNTMPKDMADALRAADEAARAAVEARFRKLVGPLE